MLLASGVSFVVTAAAAGIGVEEESGTVCSYTVNIRTLAGAPRGIPLIAGGAILWQALTFFRDVVPEVADSAFAVFLDTSTWVR